MKQHKNIVFAAVCSLAAIITGSILTGAAIAQAPPTAPAGSTLEQRVAQRKAERNIALSPADSSRLQSTCANAQSKLRTLQQPNTVAIQERLKTNAQIDAKLWVAIGKLKLAEKDTFSLEKQRTALAEKASSFQVTTQNYTQALDDAVTINCKADPTGFKASLETARLYKTQLKSQSADIRTYLVNDIKPALTTHASDLQAKPGTGGAQ